MVRDDVEVRERVARLETLLGELEAVDDDRGRSVAMETVQALLDLYGEALARTLEHAGRGGDEGLVRALAGDELVSHLLLLHGLHPEAPEARVERALERVRPSLRSHGGEVELLRVEEGVAYLRLRGSCSGCPSSTATLRTTIEEAVRGAAPELERIEAEGEAEPPRPPALVQLGGRARGGRAVR